MWTQTLDTQQRPVMNTHHKVVGLYFVYFIWNINILYILYENISTHVFVLIGDVSEVKHMDIFMQEWDGLRWSSSCSKCVNMEIMRPSWGENEIIYKSVNIFFFFGQTCSTAGLGFIIGSEIFNLQTDCSPKQVSLFILLKISETTSKKHDIIEFMKEMDSFCDLNVWAHEYNHWMWKGDRSLRNPVPAHCWRAITPQETGVA